ncbi:primosomal protein DnaI [Fervidibacillus halotolerans]|uniref:Primosomal protein DnaI n=1 Tax=Fervidibacillus halotolerans TaxID=2980027 RepID=A0A9E8M1W3_9BACI|nr:primosomal protein DnaI [Fervidibacillus halotolerans]WAA13945.1 primosomal protein DnaI [Fervidibacillus halotolerans]
MKKIGDTLNRFNERGDFQQRFERIKNEILSDQDVRAFIEKHKNEITRSMVDRSLGKLYEFISQSKGCKDCSSLAQCKNIIPGYEPELVIKANGIDVHYVPCPLKMKEDERKRVEGLIRCLYMPKESLHGEMGDVYIDTPNRLKAIKKAEQFLIAYDGTNFQKGLYLYGPFGTGKTFLLGAIANGLAEKNIQSFIVYVPELIREMKQSINDQTMREKLELLKNAPVLMFDDIGAEMVSSWARDEVLGPILQHRMIERRPTFFTSNFNLAELEHHLAYTQRGEEEKVKAARIIERIQFLAEPVMIDGSNKRLKDSTN